MSSQTGTGKISLTNGATSSREFQQPGEHGGVDDQHDAADRLVLPGVARRRARQWPVRRGHRRLDHRRHVQLRQCRQHRPRVRRPAQRHAWADDRRLVRERHRRHDQLARRSPIPARNGGSAPPAAPTSSASRSASTRPASSTGTWTSVAALDFTSPDTGTMGAKDGNSAAEHTSLSAVIAGLNIPAGATFWIRWVDTDASSSDDGLAIDDFSISATSNPVPARPSRRLLDRRCERDRGQ